MAVTPCPCRCGRRIRLSRGQMHITRERWRDELVLAHDQDVSVSEIRHVRAIPADVFERWWRGELAREAS